MVQVDYTTRFWSLCNLTIYVSWGIATCLHSSSVEKRKNGQFVMRLQLTFPVSQSSRKGNRVLGTPGKFVQQLHTYKLGEQAQWYQSAVTRTADDLTNPGPVSRNICSLKHLLIFLCRVTWMNGRMAKRQERGHINEINYHYSITSPPLLFVAETNQQKGGVILSEYGMCNSPLHVPC